jgi:hypothetical protein
MSTINALKSIYIHTMPIITLYSTFLGIDTGVTINRIIPNTTPFDTYSNLIGYTSLGIITGLTYPISYPAFGCYVLYKK